MNHVLGKRLFEVTFLRKDINEKDVLKRVILEMYFPTNITLTFKKWSQIQSIFTKLFLF